MAAGAGRKSPTSWSFVRPAIPAVHRGQVKLGLLILMPGCCVNGWGLVRVAPAGCIRLPDGSILKTFDLAYL